MATYSKGSVYTATNITSAVGGTSIPANSQITLTQVPSGPSVTSISGWVYVSSIYVLFGPSTVWNASTTQGWGAQSGNLNTIFNGILFGTVTATTPTKIVDGVSWTQYTSGAGMLYFNDYILRPSDYIVFKNPGAFVANSSWACALTLTTISQS